MTKAEKRVAVAKDVLKQVKVGRIVAMSGVYFSPTKTTKAWTAGADAQEALAAGSLKKCDACALGAALVSYVKLYDGVTVRFGGYLGSAYEILEPLFGYDRLHRIEYAFEGMIGDWWDKYPKDEARLVAIMKNIIKNKGEFRPEA